MENSGKTTNPKNKKAHGTQSLDGSPRETCPESKNCNFPSQKKYIDKYNNNTQWILPGYQSLQRETAERSPPCSGGLKGLTWKNPWKLQGGTSWAMEVDLET